MTVANMKQLDPLRQSVLNVRRYCCSTVSKNVSKGVEKVLGRVVVVQCLTHRQMGNSFTSKRRLRRSITISAFSVVEL